MFNKKLKQQIKEYQELLEELLDHVWDNAGFKDEQGYLCDCNKFRQGNSQKRLDSWNKFHEINGKFNDLKRRG